MGFKDLIPGQTLKS